MQWLSGIITLVLALAKYILATLHVLEVKAILLIAHIVLLSGATIGKLVQEWDVKVHM